MSITRVDIPDAAAIEAPYTGVIQWMRFEILLTNMFEGLLQHSGNRKISKSIEVSKAANPPKPCLAWARS